MSPLPIPAKPLDRLAIALSGVCAVHCLLVVLAVGSIPFWGLAWLSAPHFHEWFLALAVGPSLLALLSGYRSHGRLLLPASGALAMTMMLLAILLRENGLVGHIGESTLTLGGVCLLALSHWRNLAAMRRRGCGLAFEASGPAPRPSVEDAPARLAPRGMKA